MPAPVADVRRDLLELFAGVSDGRAGQGRDHPAAAVLALAAAAVVAGMKGYTAITGWVADVPPAVLAGLYLRAGAAPAPPPSKTTIWRVLTDADAGALDAAAGTWLMNLAGLATPAAAGRDAGEEDCPPALMQVRLDGKAIRGAKDADGNQVRLLAALVGPDAGASVVAAQAEVGKKTNEVPMATVVLDQIDLAGKVVTADALHTVKATATRIHERGGEFVLPVKENRRALFDALDTLPWRDVPVAHTATDKGHGRITTRTIQVLPAPEGLPFPHVSQVFLIERYVTGLRGQPISAVAALGVASPEPGRANAADLAGYVREQWSIESLHWIRDTLYQEDKSQVRTRSGPRVMAALRNLAIGAIRMAGRIDITEATRWAGRSMDRPFTILGLTS
ncbi:MAG TPA: ISAs1 family transposase [Streptosporangiaceae bacterium]|nr:ISAs1 family transposase [Streptosporangiaceae bacterium]